MKLITLTIASFLFTTNLIAQTDPKTGYTNVEYLISKLPDVKKISEELEKQKKLYDSAYQSKVKEFQEKYTSYQKTGATLPEIIKKDKEKELETMQAAIQELQTSASKDLQQKQSELIQPIYGKVYAAIQAVAEENAYKFIFNTGDSNQVRNLIVAPADGDISELVLKKMGTIVAKEKEKAKVEVAEAKKEEKAKEKTETKSEKGGSTKKAITPAKVVKKKK